MTRRPVRGPRLGVRWLGTERSSWASMAANIYCSDNRAWSSSKEVLPVSEFEGKIVLVTGCARAQGMGRAISVAFARAGADVVVTDVAPGGTRNENEQGLAEIRLRGKGPDSPGGESAGLGRAAVPLG